MNEWTVATDDFLSRLGTAICETSPEGDTPDRFVLKAVIFGIPLTYERIVKRLGAVGVGDSISEYRYAIYTPHWAMEMVYDPAKMRVKQLADVVWQGRGDFDRWQKDATLLKLSGV